MKKLFTLYALVIGLSLLFVTSTQAASSVTFYHHDALGSVIATSDQDGYIDLNEEYQPYGEKIYQAEDFNGGNEDWYTGKNYSKELDLTYFGARWYDAKQGRFLSMDPAGVKLESVHSFNRYVYANNNPYKYVDPDGRASFLVSRILDSYEGANHNFIVNNANYLGDPNADVISFGDVGDDTMGIVNSDTKGVSSTTSATDKEAWQSLNSKNPTATFRKINIDDNIVGKIAASVDKGLNYNYVPEWQGGVNSNTGAGAVAKEADGGSPRVNNGAWQPGSKVTNRITFDALKNKEDN